ncbi:BACON domain-containing protein [Neolewinella lacunae]
MTYNFTLPQTSGTYQILAWFRPNGGDWAQVEDGSFNNGIEFQIVAPAASTLTVSTNQLSPSATSTSGSFDVAGNCTSWSANSTASWITLSPSSGTGPRTVNVTYTANTSTSSRTGTITVSGCNITRTITVTQAAAASTLTVSTTQLSPSATTTSGSFNVAGTCTSWSASDNAGWITLSPSSGTGPRTVNVTYTANTSTSSRTGTITVSGCNITRTITVTQAAAASTLTVSTTQLSPDATTTTGSFNVAGTCTSWSASDNAGWITLSPSSGTGPRTVNVTYTANTSTSSRTGTITVTGCNITRTITVTQAAVSVFLRIDADSLRHTSTPGTHNFGVSSNCDAWSASVTAPWLRVLSQTGGGTGSVTLEVDVNPGFTSRSAVITVSGCGLSQSIALIQAGQNINIPWTSNPTGSNHTIILPATLAADLGDGVGLVPGDVIGFFYAVDGAFICSNYAIWTGQDNSFAVFGNDADPPVQKNGFANDERFQVRVYQQATDEEYLVEATYAPVGTQGVVSNTDRYATNGISLLTGLEADASKEQTIGLAAGWNMISAYVAPEEANVLSILGDIADQVILFKNDQGQSAIPSFNINAVGDWAPTQGYQVKMRTATELVLQGTLLDPSMPIPIRRGWQMIAYPRQEASSIVDRMASLGSTLEIVKNNAGQAYIPAFGINNIGQLLPGQGYQLKATTTGVLSLMELDAPPLSSNLSPGPGTGQSMPANSHFVLDSNFNTGNNCQIVFPADVLEPSLAPGDELGYFTPEGKLCGAGIFTGENLAITVWGDDLGTESVIEGLRTGEEYIARAWRRIEDVEFPLLLVHDPGDGRYGIDDLEIVVEADLATSLAFPSGRATVPLTVFPNPADEEITIQLPPAAVQMKIYAMDGRELFQQPVATSSDSIPALRLSVARLPRGAAIIYVTDLTGRQYVARVLLH